MVHLKTPNEIEVMRRGGKVLAKILAKLAEAVKPGVTTSSLDKLARELILFYTKETGAKIKPAFLGYGGFPAALCTSVNDEVVHGVPSRRALKEGDIIALDTGIVYDGFNLDSAISLPVLGNGLSYKDWATDNPRLAQLLEVTQGALTLAIEQAKVGNKVGQIGHAVQKHVENYGFGVIRDLVGHGIGRSLHEEPQVPNFGPVSIGHELKEGMVIAIEPMTSLGDWRVICEANGFVYRTRDHSTSAHFEHTVAITRHGPQVLTAA